MKEGTEPLESTKNDEMIFMELALRVKMRKEFDRQFGPVNFTMALRENGLAMSFPINIMTYCMFLLNLIQIMQNFPQKLLRSFRDNFTIIFYFTDK